MGVEVEVEVEVVVEAKAKGVPMIPFRSGKTI